MALDDDTSGSRSVIDFALGDFIKRHVDGRLRKAAADWLTDEASFALIEDSPPARRKRSEPGREKVLAGVPGHSVEPGQWIERRHYALLINIFRSKIVNKAQN